MTSLRNVIVLALGSALAIVLGFILAAMIEKEKRGEGFFRTIFLYPLAVSLIVTGIVWRWMFNPALGVQNFLHQLGWESAKFNWLADPATAMYGIILASIWHGLGFYMALMLAGLKSINTEIWSAAKLDGVSFWRLYVEIIIPMMKFTFLTCAILLSLGVVKTYDIVLAMTNGGPGTSTWTPAYFVDQRLFDPRQYRLRVCGRRHHAVDHGRRLPAAGAAHRLAGAPARGCRRMSAALAYETSPRRAHRRGARLSAPDAGASRGASIAIIVFLAMCAAFVSIPLYVVIVTSFKTMDQIALGEIFSLPTTWTLEGWWKAWAEVCSGMTCEGVSARLLHLARDPVPEPVPVDRAVLGDRLRAGAVECPLGRARSCSCCSCAPSCRSRSS